MLEIQVRVVADLGGLFGECASDVVDNPCGLLADRIWGGGLGPDPGDDIAQQRTGLSDESAWLGLLRRGGTVLDAHGVGATGERVLPASCAPPRSGVTVLAADARGVDQAGGDAVVVLVDDLAGLGGSIEQAHVMRSAAVEDLTRCVVALVSEQGVQSAADVVVELAGELGEVVSLGRDGQVVMVDDADPVPATEPLGDGVRVFGFSLLPSMQQRLGDLDRFGTHVRRWGVVLCLITQPPSRRPVAVAA